MTRHSNGMPLVHHARRTISNRAEDNPFTTDACIEMLLAQMADANMKAGPRVARLLQVEMDILGDLIS